MNRLSLRTRIVLIVSLVTVVFSAAGYASQRYLVHNQYLELERRAAVDDLMRCEDAVMREVEQLAAVCAERAQWDEMADRSGERDGPAASGGHGDAAPAGARCDAEWIVARDGEVLFASAADAATGEELSFPEIAAARFAPDHPLLAARPRGRAVTGILRTSHGPLLVASREMSRPEGSEARGGWCVVGRLLSRGMLRRLSDSARVRLDAWDVADPARDPAADSVLGAATAPETDRPVSIVASDADTLRAFGRLDGMDGRPAVILCADVPRDISKHGAYSVAMASLTVVAAGLGTVAVLLVTLGAAVVDPLRRLSEHAARVGSSDDLDVRSGIVRGDEIGMLAGAFDEMVARLQDSRSRLADAARRACMADVARGLLHNVGNLLTSVNVSVSQIAAAQRDSRAERLFRGAGLLSEHKQDLARFLTEDDRGRLLPEYLAQASAACRQERAELMFEIDRLQTALAQAAELVAKQGEFANAPSYVERVDLEAVVSGALVLVEPACWQGGVKVERRIERGCKLVVDRMKLSQIMVNLLKNAKEAMAATAPDARRLVVRAWSADDVVSIEITDSGCGFGETESARVFESGFSTKGGGRGLGLHYCSVAVGEMGGSISIRSDGPGLGATVRMNLPRTAPAQEAAAPGAGELVGGAA